MDRERGQLAVSVSYGFPVTWTEGVNGANLARFLKQGRVEHTDVITQIYCEIYKSSCYSVVECQNKLIFENMFGKLINILYIKFGASSVLAKWFPHCIKWTTACPSFL